MNGAVGAPAGVGAPALSAATRLIPVADDDGISIHSNRSSTVVERVRAATAVADPPAPPPSTTAAGANGSDVPRVPTPPGAGQASGGRDRLPLRPQGRPAAAPAPLRRRGQRRGRIGRGALVVATALVVVIVAGALLVLTNSGGGSSNASKTGAQHAARTTNAPSTKSSRSTKKAATVSPDTVTVAVLNGTSTTNLAHDISSKLTAAGYKQGAIATATDQTQSSTIVGYLPNEKSAAQAVAKSLKLGPASVQAVDANNRTVACNGSTTSCPAQVVVTVGSDLASNA
jgi:hypothetical protein